MAWWFMLGIDCGREGDAAEAMTAHFTGTVWRLAGGREVTLEANVSGNQDDGAWLAIIVPSGHDFSMGRAASRTQVEERREIAYRLYERLRSAPARYRFALVGVEVMPDALERDGLELRAGREEGLVLHAELWRELGEPAGYEPFNEGYLWQPYRGHVE